MVALKQPIPYYIVHNHYLASVTVVYRPILDRCHKQSVIHQAPNKLCKTCNPQPVPSFVSALAATQPPTPRSLSCLQKIRNKKADYDRHTVYCSQVNNIVTHPSWTFFKLFFHRKWGHCKRHQMCLYKNKSTRYFQRSLRLFLFRVPLLCSRTSALKFSCQGVYDLISPPCDTANHFPLLVSH